METLVHETGVVQATQGRTQLDADAEDTVEVSERELRMRENVRRRGETDQTWRMRKDRRHGVVRVSV